MTQAKQAEPPSRLRPRMLTFGQAAKDTGWFKIKKVSVGDYSLIVMRRCDLCALRTDIVS